MEIKLPPEEKIRISNSKDVHQVLLKILEREEGLGINQEYFWVLGLSHNHISELVDLKSLANCFSLCFNKTKRERLFYFPVAGYKTTLEAV